MTIRARAIIAARRRSAVEIFSGSTLGMVMGTSAWGWDDLDRLNAQWANYQRLGVTFVRFDLNWAGVQPTNSTTYDWSTYDMIINGIVAHGMKPLPILDSTPAWASNAAGMPANAAQYGTFAGAAAARYKGRVRYWEIWNEENLSGSWNPQPDPVAYTNLLKAAYPAIKAQDSTAVVILGGLSSAPDTALPDHWGEIDFLAQVYANGGKNYFDHVAVHPYSYPLLPNDPAFYNGWQMMATTSPSVRSVMVDNGDSAKQIWITEFGAPTGSGPGAVTESVQATHVTMAHSLAASYAWAGPLIWYEYWDQSTDLTATEMNFGLLRNDYTPKPAYNAYLHLKSPGSTAASVNLKQGVNSYTSTVDTRLNQLAPTTAYGSATTIVIGGDLNGDGSNQKSQGLLRFDNLFGAGTNQIPLGATIVAAELRLTVTIAGHGPSIHRMLTSWAATDTWNSRTNGISIDGIEALNTPVATDYWLDLGTGRFDVTDDVNTWSGGATNNGWLLESSGWSTCTLSSAQGTTPPQLLVTYIT